MNTNNSFGESQGSTYTTVMTSNNGKTTATERNTDKGVYVPNNLNGGRKSKDKKVKGITSNGIFILNNACYWFARKYGIKSLKWLVIDYSSVSDEGWENITKDFRKVMKKLIHILKNICKSSNGDSLYAVTQGLQGRISHKRSKLFMDVNVMLVHLKPNGETYFDMNYLINQVYKAISKVAKEIVEPPICSFKETPYNDEKDFGKLANYFSRQGDIKNKPEAFNALKEFSINHPDIEIIDQWYSMSDNLRTKVIEVVKTDLYISLEDVKDKIGDKFNNEAEILPNYSKSDNPKLTGLTINQDNPFEKEPSEFHNQIINTVTGNNGSNNTVANDEPVEVEIELNKDCTGDWVEDSEPNPEDTSNENTELEDYIKSVKHTRLYDILYKECPHKRKSELWKLLEELYKCQEWRNIESFKDLIFVVKSNLADVNKEIRGIRQSPVK